MSLYLIRCMELKKNNSNKKYKNSFTLQEKSFNSIKSLLPSVKLTYHHVKLKNSFKFMNEESSTLFANLYKQINSKIQK